MNTDRLAKVRGGQGGTRAFTLIELLVIFALMAMMLSMMGPAFVKARDKARELQCLTTSAPSPSRTSYTLPTTAITWCRTPCGVHRTMAHWCPR